MKQIKIGLLGTGMCAQNYHMPTLLKLNDIFKVVAVCGRSEQRAQKMAKQFAAESFYTDFRELINSPKVEAVISSLPYSMNLEIAAEAAKAGKHLLLEKPLCDTIKKAEDITKIDFGGKVLGVAENWLYLKSGERVKEILESGIVGKPILANHMGYYYIGLHDPAVDGSWRNQTKGGILFDRAIHGIAYIRGLFGKVVRVQGTSASIRPQLGSADCVMAVLEHENNVKTLFSGCASSKGFSYDYDLAILCETGSIVVSDFFSKITVTTSSEKKVFKTHDDHGYTEEMKDFYNAITMKSAFKSNISGAYNDLYAILSVLEK